MPGWLPPPEPLTVTDAEAYVRGICFKTGPPRRLGVELEWIVQDLADPTLPVPPGRLAAALASLPGSPDRPPGSPPGPGPGTTPRSGPPGSGSSLLPQGSVLTREPGGQVELSSLPATSLPACVTATAHDLHTLRGALHRHGLGLAGHGHDPWRPPRRVLTLPRYTAMEQFFDRTGPAGRSMMSATASVQVCVDAGTEEAGPWGFARRWRLAHLLGPVLVAAFANSPLSRGRPSGWRSTRQAVWSRMDPSRTLAPAWDGAEDPRSAWASYALDAAVMCVRQDGPGPWPVPVGLTFRQWLTGGPRGCGGVSRPPTLADLEYHLTTLFPPVRPRGHLELRMIDAQPGEHGWTVPVAVVAALFADPAAALVAERAAEELVVPGPTGPRNRLWLRAARHGLTDPALHGAALACFDAAVGALPGLGADDAVMAAVTGFRERHVVPGRCPAEDLLEAVRPSRPCSGARPRPGPAVADGHPPAPATAVAPSSPSAPAGAPTSARTAKETPSC
ncbi:ergothioneine biosynthesis glutamate--cysteine ligase EgtA [Wenjunlia vitaminophila]|uniref:Glutamate--cysteine ligase EgtA n=1 Tax=Wenjunlia vitaminophila TaxID=76728 RepID=A0A0T6LPI9_WENVI|nr:ergothioneine biosynthesis glutamate--cysteine ligase EgtA [Wenjunlia vitaminophila]KRV47974.1 ergothioneine biosynthesis glutamate--cysteine ligase EgtA [Wenjunlia vitaminophila]